jgi:tellurite resistance protein
LTLSAIDRVSSQSVFSLDRMEHDAKIGLLGRVARSATKPGQLADPEHPVSILSLAAASYGARPEDDATVPTGFDPVAVALFESIVEGAYLVAAADGVVDEEERQTFEHVVVTACGGAVAPQQIAELVGDLADQLTEDGVDRRVSMLARQVTKRDHALEIVRIGALLAEASNGVGAEERVVLGKIAAALKLEDGAVDAALNDVKEAIEAASHGG